MTKKDNKTSILLTFVMGCLSRHFTVVKIDMGKITLTRRLLYNFVWFTLLKLFLSDLNIFDSQKQMFDSAFFYFLFL